VNLGEELHDRGVRDAAVDDLRRSDTGAHPVRGGSHRGSQTGIERLVVRDGERFGRRQFREQRVRGGIEHAAGGVEEDRTRGVGGGGDRRGHFVGREFDIVAA